MNAANPKSEFVDVSGILLHFLDWGGSGPIFLFLSDSRGTSLLLHRPGGIGLSGNAEVPISMRLRSGDESYFPDDAQNRYTDVRVIGTQEIYIHGI